MRQSIIDLFQQVIVFKYTLPHENIDKSEYTSANLVDYCYSSSSNEQLAEIIYNSIIDYAFNENEITENLDKLLVEALVTRLRMEEDDTDPVQEKYGFFGEVLLNLFLHIFFSTTPIIAKGYFYDILKPEEPKGYDSYHLIETPNNLELWFGEVKFHQKYKSALNSVFKNIEKAISDNYFQKNLLALLPHKNNLNVHQTSINGIIEFLRANPKTTIESLVNQFNLKLIYPIFIICNSETNYETTISSIVSEIKSKHSGKNLNIGINYELFFLLMPIDDVKSTKLKVLQWIKSQKQLTLL
jgi:hypothetical protein